MSEDVVGQPTNRWAGTDAVAWMAAAVGLLAREPAVFLVAGVGVAFSAYARFDTPPRPELRISRTVDEPRPEPGDTVTVTLTVENCGEAALPDVRVADGVPADLAVQSGTAHLGAVLLAGESRTHTYAVRAERGVHEFGAAEIACRSLGGAHAVEVNCTDETTITCRQAMSDCSEPPTRGLVSRRGGRVGAERGGSGVEFYGVREYRPGDRAERIDWARHARTGELATLEFREERTVTAVLLVDARTPAYVRAADSDPGTHAVEWSVRAAATVFAGLSDGHNRVGIAAIGSAFAWLGPGTGETHRRRAIRLLSDHPALSPTPPRDRVLERTVSPSSETGTRTAEQLRRLGVRLPADVQVFFLSPLADDVAVAIARRLQAAGDAVTVVSPDVAGSATLGERVARLDRRRRIRELQGADVRVVDWDVDERLAVAFERRRVAKR